MQVRVPGYSIRLCIFLNSPRFKFARSMCSRNMRSQSKTVPKALISRVRARLRCPDDLGGDRVSCEDADRPEEHTSELQSRFELVCRLLHETNNAETEGPREREKTREV